MSTRESFRFAVSGVVKVFVDGESDGRLHAYHQLKRASFIFEPQGFWQRLMFILFGSSGPNLEITYCSVDSESIKSEYMGGE